MTNFDNKQADIFQKIMLLGALNGLNNGQHKNENQNSNREKGHGECNLNLKEHLKYADALVLAGIIDKNTANSIKEKMTAQFGKASDVQPVSKNRANFESDFLKARNCLLNYLNSLEIELDEKDLAQIESVVTELEKNAIERQNKENSKSAIEALNSTNELAKNRLNCTTLTNPAANSIPKKSFTMDEIAKMSTAEFLQNEPAINYQLQNGLL